MLPLLVSALLAQGSPSMTATGPGSPAQAAATGVADIFTLLPSAPSSSEQCTGDALASTQGTSVTFARASDAYCTKGDGSMVLLTTDEPRVQSAGLLGERARTNAILRSQTFDNATWVKHSTGVAAPVVTADAAVAPDGTTTADQLDIAAISGTNRTYLQQSYTATAVVRSVSLYVKGCSGSGTVYITSTPDAVSWVTAECPYTAGAWARCQTSGTMTAATWNVLIGVDGRDPSQEDQPAQCVYIWGAQEEIGAFASSYIPTAGTAATRAAETITAEVPEDINTEGCFAATATFGATVSVAGWVETDGLALLASSATLLSVDDGTDTATATVSSMASTTTAARAYWHAGTSTMGVAKAGEEPFESTFDGSASSDNVITIGGDNFVELRNIRVDTSAGGCQ